MAEHRIRYRRYLDACVSARTAGVGVVETAFDFAFFVASAAEKPASAERCRDPSDGRIFIKVKIFLIFFKKSA